MLRHLNIIGLITVQGQDRELSVRRFDFEDGRYIRRGKCRHDRTILDGIGYIFRGKHVIAMGQSVPDVAGPETINLTNPIAFTLAIRIT